MLREAVVVRLTAPRAVTAIEYLPNVLESAEAVVVRGASVQPLQHMLLRVNASHSEVGGREMAMITVVVAGIRKDRQIRVHSHLSASEAVPVLPVGRVSRDIGGVQLIVQQQILVGLLIRHGKKEVSQLGVAEIA